MNKIIYLIYRHLRKKKLRSLFLELICSMEGGQMISSTAREIMKTFHDVEIGKYSYGCFNYMNFRPGITIGRYCSFGRDVIILDANHPVQLLSTHPYFYDPTFGYVNRDMIEKTRKNIGNDVWVGHRVIILPSCHSIGNGAIIGAGSVLTKSVPDFAIVAGNPAKFIRSRFSEETKQQILQNQWWNKEIEELQSTAVEFAKILPRG